MTTSTPAPVLIFLSAMSAFAGNTVQLLFYVGAGLLLAGSLPQSPNIAGCIVIFGLSLVIAVAIGILAAALQFVFGWALASLAFWTNRLHAIMHLYDRVTFVFAGQIAPLSLLPEPLAVIAYILPFGYMLWGPSEILRGGATVETALLILLGQTVWLLVSWFAFVVVWRIGLRQFSAVGV